MSHTRVGDLCHGSWIPSSIVNIKRLCFWRGEKIMSLGRGTSGPRQHRKTLQTELEWCLQPSQ